MKNPPSGNKSRETRAKTGVVLPPTPRVDLKTIDDVRVEMAKLYRAMKSGELDCQQGTRLAYVLAQIGKLIELHEVDVRLTELEARANEKLPKPA